MARNHRGVRRDIARQTNTVAETVTVTPAILDTIALKNTRLLRNSQVAGGTLIRFKLDINSIIVTGAVNPIVVLWGVIADDDSVIGDLPDPTGTSDLDLFAPYYFVTSFALGGISTELQPDQGDPGWHVDVKAMRRLEDNQRLFICGHQTNGAGALQYTGTHKFWWKAPKA